MIKKVLLSILFCGLINLSQAQQYVTTGDFNRTSKASFGVNLNSYNGELRELSDPTFQPSLGFTLGYEHFLRSSRNISLRGSLSLYTIKGDDELAPAPRENYTQLILQSNKFRVFTASFVLPNATSFKWI